MSVQELYDAYAEMERLPVDGRSADEVAARHRSEVLARLDERAAQTKRTSELSKEKLLTDLRKEAQAASSQGAIPQHTAAVSGSLPDFSRVRRLRAKLEELNSAKVRADKELERLRSKMRAIEMQVEGEGRGKRLRAQARRADLITYVLGGITVVLSVAYGPALPGVSILAIGLGLVGIRLIRGRSALMLRAAQKRPALETLGRVRFGYVLSVCGWLGVISLMLSLAGTAVTTASGVNLTLGAISRQSLDAYWFVGLAGALLLVSVAHRVMRGSR